MLDQDEHHQFSPPRPLYDLWDHIKILSCSPGTLVQVSLFKLSMTGRVQIEMSGTSRRVSDGARGRDAAFRGARIPRRVDVVVVGTGSQNIHPRRDPGVFGFRNRFRQWLGCSRTMMISSCGLGPRPV